MAAMAIRASPASSGFAGARRELRQRLVQWHGIATPAPPVGGPPAGDRGEPRCERRIVTQRLQSVHRHEEHVVQQVIHAVGRHAREQHRLHEPRVAAIERAERRAIAAPCRRNERGVDGRDRVRGLVRHAPCDRDRVRCVATGRCLLPKPVKRCTPE
jgi:hypothetical protein